MAEGGSLSPPLSELRRSTRVWFENNCFASGDWLLVLTELASNAANASPEGGAVDVVFTASVTDETLTLTVVDAGPGFSPPETFVPADPTAGSGRGLALVAAVTDGLEVGRAGGRTATRCWGRLVSEDCG